MVKMPSHLILKLADVGCDAINICLSPQIGKICLNLILSPKAFYKQKCSVVFSVNGNGIIKGRGKGINKTLFIYNFISWVLEEIQVPQDCTGAESV